MPEVGRHYADNGVQIVVHPYLLADDIRVCAEAPLPGTIAQDGNRSDSRHVVLRANHTPHRRIHSQDGKIVGGMEHGFHACRLIAAGEVAVDGYHSHNSLEELRIALKIFELRLRQSRITLAELDEFARDFHELLGILVGKRTKEDGVDDAEDGGVRANAERERNYGDRR